MAKNTEREKAIILRKSGTSISDIARQLEVSKSTVSYWCRDISLTQDAIAKITKLSNSKSTSSLLLYSEILRKKRQHSVQLDMLQGKQRLGSLSKRDIFCIGLGLYWGEGYKRGNQEFGFTNSDPSMIIFYIRWLHSTFSINKSDLTLRVSINEQHQNRVKEVELYWSNLTKIPLTNFTKTSLIRTTSKKVYSNSDVHMGTLRIKVQKGARMRRQILGALESIALE